jgi:hypothetical protein
MSLLLYSFRRATFCCRDSTEVFWRRWSTGIPMDRAILRGILASYRNSELLRLNLKLRSNTNLQLLKGETTTGADAAVVLDGGASNNRAKEVDGTGSNSSRLGDAGLTTAELATGLVEVGPHAALPLLAEVGAGELLYSEKKSRPSASITTISRSDTNIPSRLPPFSSASSSFPLQLFLLRSIVIRGLSTWLCLMAIAVSFAVP